MGRKRAIEELTKIYESTHPLVDGSTTPTRDRVWPSVSNYVEKQPKKNPAVSRKRRSLNTLQSYWFFRPSSAGI